MEFTKSFQEIVLGETGAKTFTKTANDFKKELDSFYFFGQEEGKSAHLLGLHDHFRWRNGFLYAFSGYPGAGKSTFIHYLFILLAKNDDKKIAVYSPESYPIEDLVEELMRMYIGGNISKGFSNQVSEDLYYRALEFINEHFYFLDFEEIPSIQDVLAEFSRLINTKEVGICLIDPFNAVAEGLNMSGGGNISIYLKGALTQAKLFAVKHKVPLCLVEHPKSIGGKTNEDRPEPSPFMIYGGSMWWNKVDVFTTIDRNMFDSSDSYVNIKIWKVKKQRMMGRPGEVTFSFDYETSRFR